MQITYYGHSCFGINCEGKSIVFDPFITDNPLAGDIHLHNISCDYLLLSHGHGDHVGDAIVLAKMTGAQLISCFEITEWAHKQGVSNFHPMNIGGKKKLDCGSIKMVSAVHSSSFSDGSYAGAPAGFVLSSNAKNIYYAGDTALFGDMKLIAEEFIIDCAILPIGDNFTMGVDDAIKAAKLVGCNKVIGMHYDTFGYIVVNHQEAIQKFKSAGIELILLQIGNTLEL
jgi:L-ascorbate metabolism protein UlaG (beta-lactamase superfamily)